VADKPSPVRRIVTGHGADGSAQVFIDEPARNVRAGASPGHFSTLMWCSETMPVKIPVGVDIEDMGGRMLGTYPPVNGTRFMIAEFPPAVNVEMHRTETIDYVIVLDGEIEMESDQGRRITMKRNDVLIQRGTNHRWINNGDEVCRLAFVLIDAEPLGIGDPIPRGGIASLHQRATGAGDD
jgi:quercetin dioxygenase-like cupin family protein